MTRMTDTGFLNAVRELNLHCGHNHRPEYHNGYAQYGGTWCKPWAELVAAQRNHRRKRRA